MVRQEKEGGKASMAAQLAWRALGDDGDCKHAALAATVSHCAQSPGVATDNITFTHIHGTVHRV
jgi:hypothetical protein